jgi:hypothetical protein
MSSVKVLQRTSEYVVEWAEHDADSRRRDESLIEMELLRIVRFRIEGARRVEPTPADTTDPEAMVGELPF